MKRFSKLKKQIENLFDPALKMQFCCSAYPMRSTTGYAHNSIPRFYLKMGDVILWDYPKDFSVKDVPYGYWAGHNGISELVREYIDTPFTELLNKEFSGDRWEHCGYETEYGLTDLFKAADRRISKKKLVVWSIGKSNVQVNNILIKRLSEEILYKN